MKDSRDEDSEEERELLMTRTPLDEDAEKRKMGTIVGGHEIDEGLIGTKTTMNSYPLAK